jgi:flagellar biosynthesis/type III secretory pathway chaperone
MTDTVSHQFKSCLTHSSEAVEHLCALLEKEKQALSCRELDSLNPILTEKKLLIARIEQLENERNQLLVSAGFSADKKGHHDFLTQFDDSDHSLDALWESFSLLIHQCDQLNHENAAIADACQANLQHLINMLGSMFESGQPSPSPYTAKGTQNTLSGSSREIGKV